MVLYLFTSDQPIPYLSYSPTRGSNRQSSHRKHLARAVHTSHLLRNWTFCGSHCHLLSPVCSDIGSTAGRVDG
jgi:hypothetical protein